MPNVLSSVFVKRIPFLFLILWGSFIYAQDQKELIYLEKNVFKSDSLYNVSISFRIKNSNLVFVKENGNYSGGLDLSLEVFSNNKIVDRKYLEKKKLVSSYEETISDQKYLQGFESFILPKGNYEIKPFLNILNSQISLPLKPVIIELKDSLGINSISPIILLKSEEQCSDTHFELANYENAILYGKVNTLVLIPVINDQFDSLMVEVTQEGEKRLVRNLTKSFNSKLELLNCINSVYLQTDSGKTAVQYFILDNFAWVLSEGKAKFTFFRHGVKYYEYFQIIAWTNKPKSLSDPEYAYKLIELIERKAVLNSILKENRDDYLIALNKYWSGKNKEKSSPINKMMEEFYLRADHAIENFSTISVPDGTQTDRGKIYIRFGKPDDISRLYNQGSSVKEVWTYNSINKKFVFRDDTGLGNYKLEK